MRSWQKNVWKLLRRGKAEKFFLKVTKVLRKQSLRKTKGGVVLDTEVYPACQNNAVR